MSEPQPQPESGPADTRVQIRFTSLAKRYVAGLATDMPLGTGFTAAPQDQPPATVDGKMPSWQVTLTFADAALAAAFLSDWTNGHREAFRRKQEKPETASARQLLAAVAHLHYVDYPKPRFILDAQTPVCWAADCPVCGDTFFGTTEDHANTNRARHIVERLSDEQLGDLPRPHDL